jgi:hypothetical protein
MWCFPCDELRLAICVNERQLTREQTKQCARRFTCTLFIRNDLAPSSFLGCVMSEGQLGLFFSQQPQYRPPLGVVHFLGQQLAIVLDI